MTRPRSSVTFFNILGFFISINNSLSDDEMYNQQNDDAESTCVGERIYLPYNLTKIEESGGETNLLPDAAEPTVSDNEEKPMKKMAILSVVNGGVDVSRNHRSKKYSRFFPFHLPID